MLTQMPFLRRPARPSIALLSASIVWMAAGTLPSAEGAIGFSGSVFPNPPTNDGAAKTLFIGDQRTSNDDTLGLVQLNPGDTLLYDRAVLGLEEEDFGDLVITGTGSRLTVDGISNNDPAMTVGEEGTGYLRIADGGRLDVSSSNGVMSIGHDPLSLGIVEVTDRFTRVTIGDELLVGQGGYGRLTVSNGARIMHSDPDSSGQFSIGVDATGEGEVYVSGATTIWQMPEDVTIGGLGSALMRISDGATVDADNGFSGATAVIGARGRLELDNGRFLSGGLTVNGYLGGDGTVRGPVTVAPAADVQAGEDQTLRFTGDVTNNGSISVDGGSLEFVGEVTNAALNGTSPPASISVQEGSVRFTQDFTNDAVLSSSFGQNQFYGSITNTANGEIAVAGDQGATFHDPVDVGAGDLTVFVGATALFLSDLALSSTSTLTLALGDPDSPDNPSQISVAGDTTLGGTLNISLANGYAPAEGDVFDLIDATGNVAGVFDTTNLPALGGGLEFQLSTAGVARLTVVQPVIVVNPGGGILEGDFNDDGVVDAADYTVWRQSEGMTGEGLAADVNGDLVVDDFDYRAWRANYGRTANSGGSTASVPEPASLVLVMLISIAGLSRRMR